MITQGTLCVYPITYTILPWIGALTFICFQWFFAQATKQDRCLLPGQVNRITFCPGQAGLTWFIKYPDLTWILHWITCNDNSVFSWNKHAWQQWNRISWFSLRYFKAGYCWWMYFLKKKNTKGSRAWEQCWVVLDPSNDAGVLESRVVPCKVCIWYKNKESTEERSLGTKIC